MIEEREVVAEDFAERGMQAPPIQNRVAFGERKLKRVIRLLVNVESEERRLAEIKAAIPLAAYKLIDDGFAFTLREMAQVFRADRELSRLMNQLERLAVCREIE